MNFSSVSDLAQNLLLRRQSAQLTSNFSRLTAEIASGRTQDLGNAVRGDFNPLSALERSLDLYEGYATARADMSRRLTSTQNTLEVMQNVVENLGPELLAATTLQSDSKVELKLADASQKFEAVVLYLNTQSGGRFLFSGVASQTAPLADAEFIMDELRAAVAGATTSADFIQSVDDWFNLPGGGFETTGYQGSAAAQDAVKIGPSHTAEMDIVASDQPFRNLLKNLALNSLVSEGAAPNMTTQREIVDAAARGLIENNSELISQRATVGSNEQNIALADVQIETEKQSLLEARNKITIIDPFQAASELEAVKLQIESLYLLTARTSRLNLTEYLR